MDILDKVDDYIPEDVTLMNMTENDKGELVPAPHSAMVHGDFIQPETKHTEKQSYPTPELMRGVVFDVTDRGGFTTGVAEEPRGEVDLTPIFSEKVLADIMKMHKQGPKPYTSKLSPTKKKVKRNKAKSSRRKNRKKK